MNKVRFGVVGIGNMGSSHAKNLFDGMIDNAVLSAVCDVNPQKLDWANENLSGVSLFNNYRDLLTSGLVDAVIIATPHYLHPVIAIEAFEHKLNVLTEKPAGVYIEKVEEMNSAALSSGKTFGIMYNQRTNPIFRKAREILLSGEAGNLKRVIWIITNWYRRQEYYDSGSWRATWRDEGGGVLINQSPHNIDILQWLVGMPQKVTASCYYGKYHDIEVEDDVSAFFEFPDGGTGAFFTSTGENPGTNRLEISCDKAKIVIENGKLCLWKYDIPETEYRKFTSAEYKNVSCEYSEFIPDKDEKSAHNQILQNFVNNILFGEELIAPGYDGIKGLSISNAIHLSDWTNAPVELPLDSKKHKKYLDEKIKNSKPKNKIVKDDSIKTGKASSRWDVNW
ncbi:MAG: Gfo/Idh/MocA family oxidoreductase [Ruminococcaceae bacterium]|nr:Gfo/Idh/MocA family oxidoreductase [Oscillospiraceae bacterium]